MKTPPSGLSRVKRRIEAAQPDAGIVGGELPVNGVDARILAPDPGGHGVTRPHRNVPSLADGPKPGEFMGESYLGGDRLADFIVGLWDRRTMTIECKVSGSSVNSIKRLNNDTAAKAESWLKDFGQVSIVPVALLGGVYEVSSLERAQRSGLTIYWSHRLSDLTEWIESTRP